MCGDEWAFGWGALEALATLGAAIAAGLALYYAAGAYKAQNSATAILASQRKDEIRQARASQASLVAAWVNSGGHVIVRNASELPIYEVEYTLFHHPHPIGEATEVGYGTVTRLMSPGPDVEVVSLAATEYHEGFDGVGFDRGTLFVSLHFTDASSKRWARDWRGVLHPFREDPDTV